MRSHTVTVTVESCYQTCTFVNIWQITLWQKYKSRPKLPCICCRSVLLLLLLSSKEVVWCGNKDSGSLRQHTKQSRSLCVCLRTYACVCARSCTSPRLLQQLHSPLSEPALWLSFFLSNSCTVTHTHTYTHSVWAESHLLLVLHFSSVSLTFSSNENESEIAALFSLETIMTQGGEGRAEKGKERRWGGEEVSKRR